MRHFREHHLVLCLLLGAALLRLAPHPESIAPLGAMALFAGAYLHNPLYWLVALAGVLVGDLLTGQPPLAMGAGCVGFLLAALLGRLLLARLDSNQRIAACLPLAAAICWAATTLGVALADPGGLLAGFQSNLHLLIWHLVGDSVYALLLFSVYKLMREAPFVYYTPQN